jgi:hypothetical protein
MEVIDAAISIVGMVVGMVLPVCVIGYICYREGHRRGFIKACKKFGKVLSNGSRKS